MHTLPEQIEIGKQFSQKEIEEAFDTGFGYRISGINPRRDDNDNRYVLVFANENGPYNDSVKQGNFEYIGEGLEADQSESSPGNSTLIDAISSDFPVYFFYKEQDQPVWEYQGEVDVFSKKFEQQDGRQVLVYSMEHQTGSKNQNQGLYFVPISDEWRGKFRSSVEKPLDLTQYEEVPPQLDGIDTLRIWATTEANSPKKQAAIDSIEPGDCILFYYDGEFFSGGKVGRSFHSPETGELIWGKRDSRHIYTVDKFTQDVPKIGQVFEMVGYEGRRVVQGFSRVADDRLTGIYEEYGSIESALFGEDDREPSEEEIEDEISELEQAVESEPELTEDETQYVETRRKARNSAFRKLVRKAYQSTCAVCGSQRESPNGSPEVEAAHIYPKSEGGKDDVRNGITLCKLHHWAFDSGWISITDDHTVIVAGIPERKGYDEFKQLEGQSLHLPDNENAVPHSKFLEQHRQLHGFDDE